MKKIIFVLFVLIFAMPITTHADALTDAVIGAILGSSSDDEGIFQAAAYYEQGKTFYDQGKYDKALDMFTRAINIAPTLFTYAYVGRGFTYEKLNDLKAAYNDYSMAIRYSNGMDADAYVNRGRLLKKEGKYAAAKSDFENAISAEYKNPAGYYYLGTIEEYNKNYDHALELYDKTLEINDKFFVAYSGKGSCLQMMRRYKDALKAYGQYFYVKKEMKDKNIKYNTWQDSIYNFGKSQDVEAYMGTALASVSELYTLVGGVRNYYGARDAALKAIELEPRLAEAYVALGFANLGLLEYDEASANFDRALAINGNVRYVDFGQALLGYDELRVATNANGMPEYNQQEVMAVIQNFNEALDVLPDLAIAYFKRGVLYVRIKQYDNALQDLNKAISLQPDYAPSYYYVAVVYLQQNDIEKAMQYSQKTIQCDSKYPPAYELLGWCYELRGDSINAIDNYKKFLQYADPNNIDNIEIEDVKIRIHELGGTI